MTEKNSIKWLLNMLKNMLANYILIFSPFSFFSKKYSFLYTMSRRRRILPVAPKAAVPEKVAKDISDEYSHDEKCEDKCCEKCREKCDYKCCEKCCQNQSRANIIDVIKGERCILIQIKDGKVIHSCIVYGYDEIAESIVDKMSEQLKSCCSGLMKMIDLDPSMEELTHKKVTDLAIELISKKIEKGGQNEFTIGDSVYHVNRNA